MKLTLKPNQLFHPAHLNAKELSRIPKAQILGQNTALEALNFGLNMRAFGYNIYCAGTKGTGRTHLTLETIRAFASTQKTPDDICYVCSFDNPRRPNVLTFPTGEGLIFANHMKAMIQTLKKELTYAFEDASYKIQLSSLEKQARAEKQAYFDRLQAHIKSPHVALVKMPEGIAIAPKFQGQVLEAPAFNALPLETRKTILTAMQKAQKELETTLKNLPNFENLQAKAFENLNRIIITKSLNHAMASLYQTYAVKKEVLAYLKAVEDDILGHVFDLSPVQQKIPLAALKLWDNYLVNVLVSAENPGAPVIHLNTINVSALIGKIEHIQQAGSVLTDFTLIKAGALLKAHGGYLVMEAKELLANPKAWLILKECLFQKQVKFNPDIEGTASTDVMSLDPRPLPLDVKVILIGEAYTYFEMLQLDEAFAELFKVYVHFNAKMKRTPSSEKAYAGQLLAFTKNEKLPSLSVGAINILTEYASRLSDNQHDLTLHISKVRDIIRESALYAQTHHAKTIQAEHIETVLENKKHRFSYIQDELLEMIERGVLSLTTRGEKVGQLNALAVQRQGEFFFGRPNRITCQIRMGKGDLIDIEREVELGGPIHSKGVLILASFLASRFSMTTPLALDASLVFEQSYLPVDGDSASSAELYCLLSAIANVPLNQGLAVTGSVNQLGQVQAVGAVNEKIEGYFDVCARMGLTGEQGVIIPTANIQNLMLKKAIRDAVDAKKFHLYAVDTIDAGMEILTGLKAGTRLKNGFTKGSLNDKITRRLQEFYAKTQNHDEKSMPSLSR